MIAIVPIVIDRRQQKVIRKLWTLGRLSRGELHEETGLSPNAVGTIADALIRAGLIRECPPEAATLGRPRVPLEIDPSTRHVLGLALVPGYDEIARVDLTGNAKEGAVSNAVEHPSALIKSGANLLKQRINKQTLGVGISVTGFIDLPKKTVIFSSALPGQPVEQLDPIFTAAGDLPAVLGNDMHALAARWLLTHRAEHNQDVLLVWFTDGRLGSALLIDGRPNRGCATGANELGHTRFFVETEPCFCGQVGCLERIVSTEFIRRNDRKSADGSSKAESKLALEDRVNAFAQVGEDASLDELLKYFSGALANSINFIRPHRLVLVSPFLRRPAFREALSNQTRALVLPGLGERVQIDVWDQPSSTSAENAAWLALAELLHGGWHVADAGVETPSRRLLTNQR